METRPEIRAPMSPPFVRFQSAVHRSAVQRPAVDEHLYHYVWFVQLEVIAAMPRQLQFMNKIIIIIIIIGPCSSVGSTLACRAQGCGFDPQPGTPAMLEM